MGDINITTQSVDPAELKAALGDTTPAEAALAQSEPAQQSSTVETGGDSAKANSAIEELVTQMAKNMEAMTNEIRGLKSANAKLAMAGTLAENEDSIDEALANFFGY